MEGIGEGVQVINATINGTETALKLTGQFTHFVGHELKKLIMFLMAGIKERANNLKKGEMEMPKLMDYCNKNHIDFGCLQIEEDQLDDFANYCEKNGLSYSIMFDANLKDTYKEVVYPQNQATFFEAYMAQYPDKVKPYTIKEWLDNADPDMYEKALQFKQDKIKAEELEKELKSDYVNILDKMTANAGKGVNGEELVSVEFETAGEPIYIVVPKYYVKKCENGEYKLLLTDKQEFDVYRKSDNAKYPNPLSGKTLKEQYLPYTIKKKNELIENKDVVTFKNKAEGITKNVSTATKDAAKSITKEIKDSIPKAKER